MVQWLIHYLPGCSTSQILVKTLAKHHFIVVPMKTVAYLYVFCTFFFGKVEKQTFKF